MERFTVDHLLQLKVPAVRIPFDLSPDGRFLGLTMVCVGSNGSVLRSGESSGVPQEVMRPSVVVIDTEDASFVNPFGDTTVAWAPQWSPCGRYLAAFLQENDNPACLAIWDRRTSDMRVHYNAKYVGDYAFEVPRWTEDGRWILMKVDPGKPDVMVGKPDDSGIRRRTSNASGVVPVQEIEKKANLASVDVRSGEVALLAEDWLLRCWRPSPDGSHVACLRLSEHDDVSGKNMCDLMVVDVADGKHVCVAGGIGQSYTTAFSWSPDGTRLCYMTWGGENSGHPFVVGKDGGSGPVDLTGESGVYVRKVDAFYELPPRWSPDSEAAYLLVPDGIGVFGASGEGQRKVSVPEDYTVSTWLLPQETPVLSSTKVPLAVTGKDGTLHIAELDLENGAFQEKLKIDGAIQPCTLLNEATSDGNKIFIARESATEPPEVIKVSRNGETKRVFKPLSSIDSVEFGTPELVEFENDCGESFKAALMLPPGFDGSRPVPAITVVYGDYSYSEEINRFGFTWSVSEDNAHFLAHRGYAVVYPDTELSDGDPMNQIVDRTTPVIEHLIDRRIIDPNRIGLYGHSYGAYSVLALITRSDLFRAAVANAPIANLSSFYGRGSWFWFETGQGGLGKPPWGDPEAYVRNSPLFFLDKVQASVLLVNGSEDIASAGQAAEVYSGLLRLGRNVEWIQYEGADHFTPEWERTKFEHLCNAILDWFDENL
ncbi:MAG: prolyl oligopeptidase family serine peptidase [Gemmatimonadota bacterium]|nr:prolyl oligopeptidase family serine peptidase [Gemmatimonadota bacterium]